VRRDGTHSLDTPDEARARRAYDDAVDYLSDVYEEIFTSLRQTYDAVVTVVDHGELLGEHGHWNHVHGLYPELTRVPLVISGADVPSTNTEQVVSLLDVHRTVAELLGVADETDGRGRSLLKPLDPRPQYTEFHGLPKWIAPQLERAGVADEYDAFDQPLYGVVTPDGRYGYQSVDGPRGELPEAKLRELIDDFTETVPTEFDAAGDGVDDAVRDRLEELGYA
jgi:arylsulfatase